MDLKYVIVIMFLAINQCNAKLTRRWIDVYVLC